MLNLKMNGKLGKSTRLGFGPVELPKNMTLQMREKKDGEKDVEYNRLRTSPKHRHKMQRKSRIPTNEKRNNLMERGQLEFHLATDERFIDERAHKRVSMGG